ncbi:LysE family translocator [Pseudomonas sp. DTU_2021_1001937_2_SI_NGA_ILE_001]|uniref:LysE family translocator n=1 Tax=Pseudomonas sp. DTU_2021_1001937_2_SI_NGA_ILE_001 TaxID=3077589 RepID=UPI0028FC1975|nr:LysE family translocator [Pseudomonas sp. DTU_2021_1001937_2_SI_NGA_ILE_001]WNW13704.1 LysE family translocator [Pseudomonas sp. DTU_2021_1001937_2_SI_NGA_ILE_001]
MNTALILSYTLTVLLLIATPGPVVALVTHTASQSGTRRAMTTLLGTNLASLVLIGAAAWIIVSSAALDARLLNGLSVLGCLFMAWLGLGTLRGARGSDHAEPASINSQGGWLQGFLTGIANPKDIVFFLAFFPQFLQVTSRLESSLLLLVLIWVVLDLAVLSAWILLAVQLTRRGAGRLVRLGSATALLLIAMVGLAYNLSAVWR